MSNTPTYNERELKKILSDNGYYFQRVNGSHRIYKNDNNETITIAFNKCNKAKMLMTRIIKRYGLEVK
jgi:predicted RNA binding protein YcfA (HicA-like mRNA interferase family)